MKLTASKLFAPLAVCLLAEGCRHVASSTPTPNHQGPSASGVMPDDAIAPSPRLIVGRVLAIDVVQRFVFVEVVADPPAAALKEGTELIVRTFDLHETARLQASQYIRGRTLGTKIVSGQPSPGDEVVWLAP